MNTCNTCRCNKICNHDLYGFENCNNYIPRENLIPKTQFDSIKAMSVEEMAEKYVELIMQQKSTLEQIENTSATAIEALKRDLLYKL